LPLIEQPYALKMVVVTHLIGGTGADEPGARSRNDILGQLLTGDYPSLAIARQRAAHLQLALDEPRRLVALRLAGVDACSSAMGWPTASVGRHPPGPGRPARSLVPCGRAA
jgi:hypothetical protein